MSVGMDLPAAPTDPAVFIEHALRRLETGVTDRRSPFHVIGLSTVAPTGWPRARSVVLRGCAPGEIRFHTDRRSAKCAELATDPRAAMLAYAAVDRLQIRAEGLVTLHTGDAVAEAAWQNLGPSGREIYRTAAVPGAAVAADRADRLAEAAAIIHFTVAVMRFNVVDVLSLRSGGHQRASCRFDAAGRVTEAAFITA